MDFKSHHFIKFMIQLCIFVSVQLIQLVRETTIQCLVAMSKLPHARIYPMRTKVSIVLSQVVVVYTMIADTNMIMPLA